MKNQEDFNLHEKRQSTDAILDDSCWNYLKRFQSSFYKNTPTNKGKVLERKGKIEILRKERKNINNHHMEV